MPKPTLEQVEELARQLNPQERKLLAISLAGLKGSGFIVHEVLHFPISPEGQKLRADTLANDNYYIASTPFGAVVMLRNLPLLEINFHPENYRQTRAGYHRASRMRPAGCCLPLVLTGSASRNRYLSRLNTLPALSPVNASPSLLRAPPHDSGPLWLARPLTCDSFIHYNLPVYPGALGHYPLETRP
jgi:hypothetical protein